MTEPHEWIAAVGRNARSQSAAFVPSQRYPEPNVLALDPSFQRYCIYSSTIERLGTGMRWAEGPVYFPGSCGQPGYLLLSDIPNNRLMKYDEATGEFSVYPQQMHYANGHTRDRQGRLISCEHSVTRRVVRTELDGTITIVADRFEGKRLNAPNDVVVKSDGSIWFTDPLFGISGHWEGEPAESEQATTNVYRISPEGKISAVITDLRNPNGLAFSPDESLLYVVECHNTPYRSIWAYQVQPDGSVSRKTKLIDAGGPAALDGFRVDRDGNLWCGWGFSGELSGQTSDIGGGMQAYLPVARSEDYDGVKVFNPQGQPIGFIRLPERCANLTFGGPQGNRLYMASSRSLYALYVNIVGVSG